MSTADEINTLPMADFGTDPLAIRPEVSLRHLRLDALALEELRLLIEDRMGVDPDDVQLSSRDTVGRLVDAVHRKAAA
ncbi:phosphopantetheine-binding protein [Streptomyces atratus]|uniref:Acyl carrier protein n=1 Tax=Streptomyces atratus TaxID=1893 RepID=A0A1K2BUZ4_STRAR|nr:phosphopantetheine-binding protein [Streptomyces atratus]SFY02398.1 acyl carrier protein [Streptomyces atratus]